MASRPAPKTSIDILHERDALLVRVVELESAMQTISAETALVAAMPELAFLATRRIETVALATLRARRRTGPEIRKAHSPPERQSSGVDDATRPREAHRVRESS